MDFFFFSGLRSTAVKFIVASYDIACQWYKKFWTRMKVFPETWRINMSEVNIQFLVPKFHLPLILKVVIDLFPLIIPVLSVGLMGKLQSVAGPT